MSTRRPEDGSAEHRQEKVWLPIAVRWGDMDAMGHVNNAAYFTYCESARIHYFEAIGLEVGTVHEEGFGPAVVTATCNFRRQVHYPADLEVGVACTRIGTSSFTLAYRIRRADDQTLVADGTSVVVWADYRAGTSAPLPEAFAARIRSLDGLD